MSPTLCVVAPGCDSMGTRTTHLLPWFPLSPLPPRLPDPPDLCNKDRVSRTAAAPAGSLQTPRMGQPWH